MTFNIEVTDFPWTAIGLMVGAVLIFLIAILVASQVSRSGASWLTLGAIFFSALFTAGVLMLYAPEAKQVEEIAAQTDALPGVSSSVILEEDSVPACNSDTVPTKTVVSVITDDGESVDGHLIVSEPKDGACTYELKLPIK